MKIPALIATSLTLLLLIPSCRRAAPDEEGRGADKAAEQQLAMERWQLARERAALQEELAEFDRRLQVDAENATEQTKQIGEKKEELEKREAELEARVRDLGEREAQLEKGVAEAAGAAAAPKALVVDEPVSEFVVDPVPILPEIELPAVADYGVFYDDLSPHGDWFETGDYGYVWRPTVVVQVNNWRPYCHGRWVWTDCGWSWVSNEPFGWATYHYGRWTTLPGHGWVWVPGHRWAPAWVCWRQGGSHIGWAPLPPECADGMRPLWGSTVEHEFGIGANWFCFVRTEHFAGDLGRHCLPRRENHGLVAGTTNVTLIHERRGRIVAGGPDFDNLCRRLGRRLPQLTLDFDRLGGDRRSGVVNGDRLLVTAPTVDADWNPLLKPKQLAGRIERPEDPRHDLAPVLGAIERLTERRVQDRRRAEEQFKEVSPDQLQEHRAQQLARQRELAMAQIRRRDQASSTAAVANQSGRRRGEAVAPVVPNVVKVDNPRELIPAGQGAGGRKVPGSEVTTPAQNREGAGPVPGGRRVEARGATVESPDQPAVASGGRAEEPPVASEALLGGGRGRGQQAALSQRRRGQAAAIQQEQARIAEQQKGAEEARRRQQAAMNTQREQARAAELAEQQRDAGEALQAQREQARQAQLAEQRRTQETMRQQQQEQASRAQEEARQRAQQEAMREQQEQARRAQEAAQQRAREEAMRQQQEQARRAQEEAQRRAREEAQHQAQEQARRAQEEAQRRAQEAAQEQARRAQEEAQRQAREAAQRQAEESARRRGQGGQTSGGRRR